MKQVKNYFFSYAWALMVGFNFGMWQRSLAAGLFAWAAAVVLLTPWREA